LSRNFAAFVILIDFFRLRDHRGEPSNSTLNGMLANSAVKIATIPSYFHIDDSF
jgi:hypothetical protein